jgi:hypothetical protein
MAQDQQGDRPEEGAARGVPLVIVFGKSREPGEPYDHAPLFERLAEMSGRPFGVFLLQDRNRAGYFQGAVRLGDSIETTAAALRTMIEDFAPSQVITFGEGAGGHAALVFGVLLGASRIVALEPPAHLIADELQRYNDRRWHHELDELPDPATARKYDVIPLIAAAGFHGRAFILFGTQRSNDYHDAVHLTTIHAHRLALVDQVTLCPFPDIRQGVLDGLTQHGDAESVLSHYLFEEVAAPPRTRQSTSLDSEKLTRITTKIFRPFQFHIVNTSDPENDFMPGVAFAAAGRKSVEAARRVDDGWRSWIAENLILGASPIDLEDVLVARGISEEEASREVSGTLQSPYFWGTQRLQNRLKKRDWLLATYRKLQRLRPESAEIERRYRMSRSEWLARFYTTNRPVIITGMMDDWPALWTWSLDAFSQRFGEREVEVELGRDLGDDRELARPAPRRTLPMADYVERLREAGPGTVDGSVLSAEEGSANQRTLAELWDDIGNISEYLDSHESKADSIRLGAVGAIVRLPINPVNTLLAQVMGQTQVTFAHSWDLPLVQNNPGLFSRLDGESTPPTPPLPLDEPQILESLLSPGEILFLPVGSGLLLEGLEVSATVSFTKLRFDNTFGDLPESLERS